MKTKVDLNNKTILVTGSAGFIGFYLSKRLLEEIKGVKVIGFDSVNDYYDVSIKEWRLDQLSKYDNFTFIRGNLADKELVNKVFNDYKPSVVVNLAAQAGVTKSFPAKSIVVGAPAVPRKEFIKQLKIMKDAGDLIAKFKKYEPLLKSFEDGVNDGVEAK